MKMNQKRAIYGVGLTAVLAISAFGLSGCANQPAIPDVLKVENVNSSDNKITVTGKEEVKVAPDVAEIAYAIYTRKDTAEECQTQNASDLAAAIETLTSLGVEEKSIQTSSYGMNPIYDWNSAEQAITGYEMTTRLTVSDIPIDNAGKLISESVAAGVNGIDSVNYSTSNYDEKYQEALKGAIAVAKTKAEAIAEASGKTIVGVTGVEEYGYNSSARNSTYQAPGAARTETAAAADMAVMPGELSIQAQVTVNFEIQ